MTDREALQRLHDRVSVYVAQHVRPVNQGPILEALAEARAALTSERAKQAEPIPASVLVTMYAENPTSDADMVAFAREVEKAHGIGAAPPAVQAEPEPTNVTGYAAPPADEAVRLLRETRATVEYWAPYEWNSTISEKPQLKKWYALRDEIDAYLAEVGK